MMQIKQTTERKGVSKRAGRVRPLSAPGPRHNSRRSVIQDHSQSKFPRIPADIEVTSHPRGQVPPRNFRLS
jgi:hypothetical protein